jgi:hypothetical protein
VPAALFESSKRKERALPVRTQLKFLFFLVWFFFLIYTLNFFYSGRDLVQIFFINNVRNLGQIVFCIQCQTFGSRCFLFTMYEIWVRFFFFGIQCKTFWVSLFSVYNVRHLGHIAFLFTI